MSCVSVSISCTLRSPAVAPMSNTRGPGSDRTWRSLVTERIAGGELTPASWLSGESDGGITQPGASSTTSASVASTGSVERPSMANRIPTIGNGACTARASSDLVHDCKRLPPAVTGNAWFGSDILVMGCASQGWSESHRLGHVGADIGRVVGFLLEVAKHRPGV